MKRSIHLLSCLLLGATLFMSCGKDDDDKKPEPTPEPPKVTAMELHFDSRFGTGDFVLGNTYQTASNEQIRVTNFNYFVSNVELVMEDGSTWKEPNSYHLVQVEDQVERENFTIKNMPAGNYTKLRFMLGVDSVRNQTLDLAVGDLKLDNHMTWMWHTGYIFLNIKGHYEDASASPTSQVFSYDIGKDGRQRMVELPLPATTVISGDKHPKVHLHVNVKEIFGGPNVMQLKTTSHIDGSPQFSGVSNLVADNAATMFRIDHIH